MKIDEKLLDQICINARLKLDKKQSTKFLKELNEVVKMFKSIQKVDTKKVEPMYHPVDLELELREDKSIDCNVDLKKNIKQLKKGYIVGPKLK